MFSRNEIVLHAGCKEASRQFSSWYVDKGKPVENGFELCEALCQIVSELNRTEKITVPVPKPHDYHPINKDSKKQKKKNMWATK